MIRQSNRIVVDERKMGFSLAQAIILAEYGDVIVVHTEAQKRVGEQAARRGRPNVKIEFVVEPLPNAARISRTRKTR